MNIVAGALAGVGRGACWRLGADEAAANHCVAHTLRAKHNLAHREDVDTMVAHTLRADGFDASEDGTGRGTPLVPVGVDYTNGLIQGDISSGTLEAAQSKLNRGQGVLTPVAFGWQNAAAQGMPVDTIAPTLDKSKHPATATATATAVRRLTPRECERLQGFPDDYTAIPKAADGPRYKALGNSKAVPVVRWIGKRIDFVMRWL